MLLLLSADDAHLRVSHASLWELMLKVARGRIDAIQESVDDIMVRLKKAAIVALPIEIEDIRASTELPLHHLDPFDRLLIAQARRRGFTLVSADQWFHNYDVQLLPL